MLQPTSSDSDDHDERFKNVRSLLVTLKDKSLKSLDESNSYKRKLGDLIFDADFEGGNLGHVEQIDLYDYDLMVRPDVMNPRHRIWFNFRVSNQQPCQCVVFTFVNLSENLSLFNMGLTPVVRSYTRPNWVRLSRNQIFYYRSLSHNNRRVLSIAFKFATHDDDHQFALFYPYTITTLLSFLNRWNVFLKRRISESSKAQGQHPLKRAANFQFKVYTLTWSVLSKPILEVQISAPPRSPRAKLMAIIVGRTCGNFESAASYVTQGLIDYMLSDDPLASTARELISTTVFPMLDPDSSWVGNGRTDLMGQANIDTKLIALNPSLYSNFRIVKSRIDSICSHATGRVVIIDVRVCSDLIGSRMIGSIYKENLRMERHLYLPRILSRFSETFYIEKCEFTSSNCSFAPQDNTELDCYQLDVSPFGYHTRSLLAYTYRSYEQRDYLLLGRALAHSLLELNGRKHQDLPEAVGRRLTHFSANSRDVDDLLLVDV